MIDGSNVIESTIDESQKMRELKPYQTVSGLKKAIDNGGRFYNLFTAADDAVVSRGELAKAAGVFSAGMSAFLFLEMAQQELNADDQQTVVNLLEAKLRNQFLRDRPVTLAPSTVEKVGAEGRSVIVSGLSSLRGKSNAIQRHDHDSNHGGQGHGADDDSDF